MTPLGGLLLIAAFFTVAFGIDAAVQAWLRACARDYDRNREAWERAGEWLP